MSEETKRIKQEKRENSSLKNFGFKSNFSSKTNILKSKKSKLERYGNENYCNKDKIKKTKYERYGNENFNNPEKAKITKSSKSEIEKINYSTKLSIARNKNINAKRANINLINKEYFKANFVRDNKFLFSECLEFYKIPKSSLNQLKIKFGIEEPNKLEKKNLEDSINEEFNYSFITRTRQIIKPLELDLYSEKHKLAIEYNGLMWHSYGKSKYSKFNNYLDEDPTKHLKKTELCEEKSIDLFHIFEHEWLDKNKKSIWVSMINEKLGLNKEIATEDCSIKEVKKGEAKIFLEENHLEGYKESDIFIGLYNEERLIFLISFVKDIGYEIVRFCNKKGYDIKKGLLYLLNYFERKYSPNSITLFLNRRWNTKADFTNTEFSLLYKTKPNCFYFKPGERLLISENEILEKSKQNYRKIYDCGNFAVTKRYK